MSYKSLSQLDVQQEQQVLWLSLNNPDSSNSITYEMIDSLVSTLARAEMDASVRLVVITGDGRNFCSGGDLNNMQSRSEMFAGDSNELRMRYENGIQRISRAMEAFSKPLIAMVNGAAAGAGCDLACMCDLRIGTKETKFLESFAKLSLVPGDGGTFFLQRVVGYARAMEMTLTARTVDGEEALRIGLLNRLVESSQLREETKKWAQQLSEMAPVALQLAKKAMKVGYLHDLNTSLDLLSAYQAIAQRTKDHDEALDAVKNRRAPNFTGQ